MQRKLLTIITLITSLTSFSQSFSEYKNEDFEISFPNEWVVIPKEKMPQLALIVIRKPESKLDKAQVTINVNIINTPNLTLDKTYTGFLNSLSDSENFKLLKTGDKKILNQDFKWIIESHVNHVDKSQNMHNYVFVAYKNGKTYILTMVAFSEVFENYKSIFDSISESFIIY